MHKHHRYLVASLQVGYQDMFEAQYGNPCQQFDVGVNFSAINESVSGMSSNSPGVESEWWDQQSWMYDVPLYQQTSIWEMYMASLHFSTMTMTTIGYGDMLVFPSNYFLPTEPTSLSLIHKHVNT